MRPIVTIPAVIGRSHLLFDARFYAVQALELVAGAVKPRADGTQLPRRPAALGKNHCLSSGRVSIFAENALAAAATTRHATHLAVGSES